MTERAPVDAGPVDGHDESSRFRTPMTIALAPFVLTADAVKAAIIWFFSLADALDPVPVLKRLVRPFAPLYARFRESATRMLHRLRSLTEPIKDFLGRCLHAAFGWTLPAVAACRALVVNLLAPIRRAILGARAKIDPVVRSIARRRAHIASAIREVLAPVERIRTAIAVRLQAAIEPLRRR